MLDVLPHDGATAGGSQLVRSQQFGGGHRLRLKEELRAFDPQSHHNGPRNGSTLDATAIQVNAIAALQIVDPPPAILKNNFGMDATYVVVLDADFAVVSAADTEGAGS